MRPNNRRNRRSRRQPSGAPDFGFGVDEDTGRPIHLRRDGNDPEDDSMPQHDVPTFEVNLNGKRVAGGCGAGEGCKIIVDKTETGIDGHVGVKCEVHHVGWIIPRDKVEKPQKQN